MRTFVWGDRKYGSGVPVEGTDNFSIGSLSKTFVATMIGRLVNRGALQWDRTMVEIFPELADLMPMATREITVYQLLAHQAGYPNWEVTEAQIAVDRWPDSIQHTPEYYALLPAVRYQWVKEELKKTPVYPPGTQTLYSNNGYCILAIAIERITGRSFEEAQQELVFDQVGMRGSITGVTFGSSDVVDAIWMHSISPTGRHTRPAIPGNMVNTPVGLLSGSVSASASDLAKYAASHLATARGNPWILSQDVAQILYNPPQGTHLGPGWRILNRSWQKGKILSHGGSNGFSGALIEIFPEADIAIVFLINQWGGPNPLVEALERLFTLAYSRPYSEIWLDPTGARMLGSLFFDREEFVIRNWSNPNSRVTWTLSTPTSGEYEIQLVYSLPVGIAGDYFLNIGDHVVRKSTTNTGGWDDFRSDVVKIFTLPAGDSVIEVTQAQPHGTFINIKGVLCRRVSANLFGLSSPDASINSP